MQRALSGKYSADCNGSKSSIQSPSPQTTFEQVNDLLDRLMGPSLYEGVTTLYRAAQYCADQSLIESTKSEAFCNGFADACSFLERHADSLDAYLVESFIGGQQ